MAAGNQDSNSEKKYRKQIYLRIFFCENLFFLLWMTVAPCSQELHRKSRTKCRYIFDEWKD